jgi:hypothetical protein
MSKLALYALALVFVAAVVSTLINGAAPRPNQI